MGGRLSVGSLGAALPEADAVSLAGSDAAADGEALADEVAESLGSGEEPTRVQAARARAATRASAPMVRRECCELVMGSVLHS